MTLKYTYTPRALILLSFSYFSSTLINQFVTNKYFFSCPLYATALSARNNNAFNGLKIRRVVNVIIYRYAARRRRRRRRRSTIYYVTQ